MEMVVFKMVSVVLLLFTVVGHHADAWNNFNWLDPSNDENQKAYLSDDAIKHMRRLVDFSTSIYDKDISFEKNVLSSNAQIRNGSLSHGTLLETLLPKNARSASQTAMRMLRASQYLCETVHIGSSKKDCARYLPEKRLMEHTNLLNECEAMARNDRSSNHHAFRRLLPNKYEDGLYQMSRSLTPAREMSITVLNHDYIGGSGLPEGQVDKNDKNVFFVQWAQFVEHDLSKSVARTMHSGDFIDCCDDENYKLNDRFKHPACEPLIGNDNKPWRRTCLNYVRSALAVNKDCKLGPAKQLNQATGTLDLSQLYGYVKEDEQRMRTYEGGHLKSTKYPESIDDLLPSAGTDASHYCALHSDSKETCFMAGDTRVNNNPLSIVLYTIFMRSHNAIADKLLSEISTLTDEELFFYAKFMNLAIYRRIVFDEWLPSLLGDKAMDQVTNPWLVRGSTDLISSEFAVAAMRFSFSMMPNKLMNFSFTPGNFKKNAMKEQQNMFYFKNQMHRSNFLSDPQNLNEVLQSMVHQRAMKMDSSYEESFLESYSKPNQPTRSDMLAFDIQRGRDHGLSDYVSYLEVCENIKINSVGDLFQYLSHEGSTFMVHFLKTAKLREIDLLAGGLLEEPKKGSTVGPTFTCILGEQFQRIYLNLQQNKEYIWWLEMLSFSDMEYTGAQLLCAHSRLKRVPRNIFKTVSKKNPLVSCANLLPGIQPSYKITF